MGFLVFGVSSTASLNDLKDHGVRTTGQVIDKSKGRNPSITVSFTTATGEEVTAETDEYVKRKVGDSLPLIYDPGDPATFQDEKWGFGFAAYSLAISPILGGVAFIGLGIYIAFVGVPGWLQGFRR